MKRSFYWFLLPVGAVIIVLLPLLAGWGKMFFDDIAFLFYPQQVFLSRALARGTVPWWDPHTCAGATPFYSRFFQSSLYPVNWIFLRLSTVFAADTYLWLVKIPLVFHYLAAAVTAYLFAFRGLRLNSSGSTVFSLAYTLSPSMLFMSTFPPEIFIQAWLPLLCLCLVLFTERGNPWWLLAGGGVFALASTGGDLPFVMHIGFITGLFSLGWLILAWVRGDRSAAGRTLIGVGVIFILGALLAGQYWAAMLDGLQTLGDSLADSIADLSGRHQSLHPLYLITLFIPEFFGGVTSANVWGAAYEIHCSLNDVNLLGGLAAVFLVILGFRSVRHRRSASFIRPSYGELYLLFLGITIFGLLIVLGAYTPVYRVLRVFIPVLRLPYPVRFRIIQCFAMAGLMGVSAAFLRQNRLKVRFKPLLPYLAVVVLAAAVGLLARYQVSDYTIIEGWRHIGLLEDRRWFFGRPVLYAGVVAGLLAVGKYFLDGRGRTGLLAGLVSAELIIFAFLSLYRNRILNFRNVDLTSRRYESPADHSTYAVLRPLHAAAAEDEEMHRRVYYRSVYDNLGWVFGSFSMLGFDVKPLDARFESLLEELAPGLPYELRPRALDVRFWPNMSARYYFSGDGQPVSGLEPIARRDQYVLYEFSGALPRVYFQDAWEQVFPEEAARRLIKEDLRDGGVLEAEEWNRLNAKIGFSAPYRQTDFESLQEKNRILGYDFTDPNRVVLELAVSRPAMLVMTDVWHSDWSVEVDGVKERLYRVNYLQRGVWTRPGVRWVVMRFVPSSRRLGRVLNAAGAAVVAALLVLGIRRRPAKNGTIAKN